MATKPSPPAKKTKPEEEFPMACYLPDNIIDLALTLLPLKEAAKASVLAPRFRRTWCFNKNFLFGGEFAIKYDQQTLLTLVDHLFDSHKGDEIKRFELHMDPNGVEAKIWKWLKICSQKKTEEIQLYFFKPGVKLDSDILDSLSNQLKTLKLVRCGIAATPPITRSMQLLHTLIVHQIEITTTQLQSLVANCMMLQTLELFQCEKIDWVRIPAREHRHLRMVKISECVLVNRVFIESPTIRSFIYYGWQASINFGGMEAFTLKDAIFNFVPYKGKGSYPKPHDVESMVYFLQIVTTLTISAEFVELLSARIRHDGLYLGATFSLVHLRELHLLMEASSYCNPLDILLFLKNCPNLELLFIDMNYFSFQDGVYWEVHQKPLLNGFNHDFNKLKTVKIMGIKFEPSELLLVQFLLQRSPFLQKMIFLTAKNGASKLPLSRDAPKYNHLFHSWKASQHVRIVLYGHHADRSDIHPTHSEKHWL